MALIVGFLLVAFAVYAVVPVELAFFLNWGPDVLLFLRGGAPILAIFIGLIAIFIGIADIKDKMEAKKEEAEEKAASENK